MGILQQVWRETPEGMLGTLAEWLLPSQYEAVNRLGKRATTKVGGEDAQGPKAHPDSLAVVWE